ncbi:MAG TPA: hypothetical protein PKD13_07010, partial [Mariniflexile sp.]|nr:hypothetical protein [Mariniflexile sp.]
FSLLRVSKSLHDVLTVQLISLSKPVDPVINKLVICALPIPIAFGMRQVFRYIFLKTSLLVQSTWQLYKFNLV